MFRSSAKFVSYDLRPSKQAERRILLELLSIAGSIVSPVNTYRYVGMGANRFYDYLLIHKYLGISKMISLEHDPQMYDRAVFNCPYYFIDVLEKTTTEFISNDTFEDPSIVWFDYDGGIGSRIIQDIASLSTKLKVGDFCFVTVYGGATSARKKENTRERLIWFKDEFGDVAGEVTIGDVEISTFPDAVHKVLIAAFQNAFAPRTDGHFVPFLQVEYADSTPMITVGGGFLADGQAITLKKNIKEALPFLSVEDAKLYKITNFNLTDRERVLFDRAATYKTKRSTERNQLRKMGFSEDDLSAYKDLVRYLPRYVETIV